MNILVDIAHPGHAHFFRFAIEEWKKRGCGVAVAARNIPVARRLLDYFGIPHSVVSSPRRGVAGLALEMLEHNLGVARLIRRNGSDLAVAVGGTYTVFGACLTGRRTTVFSDTETARVANLITFPFAARIITPSVYPFDIGRKHVRYGGFHELAYLHPNRFSPNPAVLSKYGIRDDERFSVVRFSAWGASHDIGLRTVTDREKLLLIDTLKSETKVLLVPEGKVPGGLHSNVASIDACDFHSLLYYAAYCVTEGATTATESCILGTPALYINPLRPRNMEEMVRYGLLRIREADQNIAELAKEFMNERRDKEKHRNIARGLCENNRDVTEVIVEQVADMGDQCGAREKG